MKKSYLMMAAAAMMFAACAETELVNEVNTVAEPQAIGFETFANKATTRATENTEEGYAGNLETHHKSFKVWASKQLAGGTYVDVYAAANPGTVEYTSAWVANPLKYWDKAAENYQFYAAAPAEASWNATNTNSANGCITLADYVLKGESKDNVATLSNSLKGTWGEATTSNDKDLMIAAACKIERTHYNNDNPGPVHLNFIHLLSKLNIAVKTTEAGVKLVKLDVCGLKNKSSFNEFADIDGDSDFDDVDKEALVHGSTKRWNTASLDGTYTLAAAGTLPLALTKDAAAVYTHEYLIIPQLQTRTEDCIGLGTAPVNDAYIEIQYTINDEPYKAFYGLAHVFGIAMGSNLPFNEGWQNTLTITISPDAITFTGDVAVWDDKLGKTEDID